MSLGVSDGADCFSPCIAAAEAAERKGTFVV